MADLEAQAASGRRDREPLGRWPLRAEFLCAAAAIACSLNVLSIGFCLDDVAVVQLSGRVSEPGQWGAIWTTDYWSGAGEEWPHRDLLYRPVAISSYRLVRTLCGADPWPQHLVNLLLHAVVSALVVRACRGLGGSERAALWAGLLFAVLPIHTEVIAGVVGRADLLATLGVVAAVLCHGRSLTINSGSGGMAWRVAGACAVFAAMGAKESGAGAALLVVLWDAVQHRRRATAGARGSAQPGGSWWSWRTGQRLAYLALPVAAYLVLRYHALGGHLYQRPPLTKTVNVLVDAPAWQHLLGVFQLWGMYWVKTVWPAVLCIDYSINAVRLATSPLDLHVLTGLAATAAVLIAAVGAWRRRTFAVVLAVVAMSVSYAPTANAFILTQVFFAERIWYLPSVWVAILVGWLVAPYLGHPAWRTVAIVLVVGMAARCWVRNAEWRDNGTLYAAAYRDHGDSVQVLHLYGQWLVSHGEYDRGVGLIERALDIDIGFTDAHRTLGLAHLGTGRLEAAVRHLQAADMQAPGHRSTAEALRRASQELSSRNAGELAELRRAAEAAPQDAEARLALVRKLRKVGRLNDALEALRSHDDRFSSDATWQREYAVTLLLRNDRDGAISRYRASLKLRPDDPNTIVELAMLLLERRAGDDLEEAWELSAKAMRLAPRGPLVLVCRAELSALRGDVKGAVALYREAIRALPANSDRRRVFEERAKALGG